MASFRRSPRPRTRAFTFILTVPGLVTLACVAAASAAPGPSPVARGFGGTAPVAPAVPNVIIYDQYDNDGGTGIVSLNPASDPSLTAFTADDFVVPAGQSWSISSVDVRETPGSVAASFNVFFYTNGAGDLPGTQVASRTNLAYTGTTDLTIPLVSPVVLNAGTYWVAVQANQAGTGFWFWQMRSVQANAGAAFQEGGAYNTNCTTWARRGPCSNTTSTPDQMFRLDGTIGGTTAVSLASFGAVRSRGAVAVSWRTATETQTAGFNVWRAARKGAEKTLWVKLNAKVIRARGLSPHGVRYTYLDRGARRNAAYAYRLEALNLDGTVQWSRTVSVARS